MVLQAWVFHLTNSSLELMVDPAASSRQVGTREGQQPGNGGDWFLIPRPPVRDRFYSPIPNCGRWECPIVPLDRNHESASNYRTSTAQSPDMAGKISATLISFLISSNPLHTTFVFWTDSPTLLSQLRIQKVIKLERKIHPWAIYNGNFEIWSIREIGR